MSRRASGSTGRQRYVRDQYPDADQESRWRAVDASCQGTVCRLCSRLRIRTHQRDEQAVRAVKLRARQVPRLTLPRLADQVIKEDGTPISPQFLSGIEVHPRVPAPLVLRGLARGLDLDGDPWRGLTEPAATVVQADVEVSPRYSQAVIHSFREAQVRGAADEDAR
jgi:hypothetical protein